MAFVVEGAVIATSHLSRRTFVLTVLAAAPLASISLQPRVEAAAAAALLPERQHRTLLGVL